MRFARKKLTPHAPPFNVTQRHWNYDGSIGYLRLEQSVIVAKTIDPADDRGDAYLAGI